MSPVVTHVGLVGCGRWGKHILRDLQLLGCRVSVVARSDESKARAGSADAIFPSIEALPDLDGYVVSTPGELHVAHARLLAPRGKPVFIEKPLAMPSATHSAADQVTALIADGHDQLFVMDKWRYHRGIQLLRSLVKEGRLGDLQGLELTRVGAASKLRDTIFYLCPHDLAISLEILGHIPEVAAARAVYREGVPVALRALLGLQPWVSIVANETAHKHFREVRVRGSEGDAVLVDSYADHVLLRRRGEAELVIPFDNVLPLYASLERFVAYLRDRSTPPPVSPLVDALVASRALDRLSLLARNAWMGDAAT